MKQIDIDKKTDSIWQEFCEIYPRMVRFNPPKIVLCNRLTRTLGKCYYWENRIHLANKVLVKNVDVYMTDILPHEIAHQVSYNIYGEEKQGRKCHGLEWREIMFSYGIFPNVTYKMCEKTGIILL